MESDAKEAEWDQEQGRSITLGLNLEKKELGSQKICDTPFWVPVHGHTCVPESWADGEGFIFPLFWKKMV